MIQKCHNFSIFHQQNHSLFQFKKILSCIALIPLEILHRHSLVTHTEVNLSYNFQNQIGA
jgi:hypothetical protein